MIVIIEMKNRLEEMTVKAEILKVIAHPIRLCIVSGLMKDEGCNVGKMQSCLDVPQPTISQHLSKLKAAGIVEGRRNGTEMNYYLVDENVKKLVECFIDN